MSNSTGPRPNSDTNYGVVGDKTLRTAAQLGNENGAVDFNKGLPTDQTVRVILAKGSEISVDRRGTNFSVFGEAPAAPVATETTLVSYTASGAHNIRGVMCSGSADAVFQFKRDGNVIARKRNNWTDRNVMFDFGDLGIEFGVGATIIVTVISSGDTAQPFEATIFGEDL